MTNRRTFLTGAVAAGAVLAAPAIVYSRGMGEFAHFVENRTPRLPLNATRLALCNAAEEAVLQGDGRHHVFYAPRNIGKTIIFSHALPAWRALTTECNSIIVARTMDVAVSNRRSMVRQALGDHYSPYEGVNEHMSRRSRHTAPGSALTGYRGDLIVVDADEVLDRNNRWMWRNQLLMRLAPNGTLITVTSHITNLAGITPKTIVKGFI